MADHPYEITWTESGSTRSEIVFARTQRLAMHRWKTKHTYDLLSKDVFTARPAGIPAECTVRYTLRGGRVYGDTFYYHDGKGPQSVPLSEVTGLRYHE